MNNEEKILAILEKQGKVLEQQGTLLVSLAEKVDRMETTQTAQGETLKEQSKTLKRLKAKVDEIDQRSARTQILLETEIRDNIKLLFDGHALINEKLEGLAPKSRVDDLEDDVAMLKDVIKLMRQDIAELKKAQ